MRIAMAKNLGLQLTGASVSIGGIKSIHSSRSLEFVSLHISHYPSVSTIALSTSRFDSLASSGVQTTVSPDEIGSSRKKCFVV